MDETHVCVLDREGRVVRESKAELTAQAVANELAKAPSCRRIVFERGRMAPILFHGLSQLGLPVVCVESRQAYQALKSLATHKTDRNDARGLAHLARTGFFKPVHVKSLPAHAAILKTRDVFWAPSKKSVPGGQLIYADRPADAAPKPPGLLARRAALSARPVMTASPSMKVPSQRRPLRRRWQLRSATVRRHRAA